MKVMAIAIVDGALVTVLNDLKKKLPEIRRRIETIQTTALLKSVRILRSFLKAREDLSLTLQFWFGFIALFNGISTFVDYLMPCRRTIVVLFNQYLGE